MNLTAVDLLQSASWPAFLVDEEGLVTQPNQTASIWFGAKLEGSPPLDTLWRDQSESPRQFLQSWEHLAPPSVTLQFEGRDGHQHTFSARISSVCKDGKKFYLFQLMKMEAPAEPVVQPLTKQAPAPEPVQSAGAAPTSAPTPAQAERLEAAAVLTRTVAIDLNNSLTSILGHASLVLSQMDASNPQRRSLEEVEKAAERAAEATTRLVDFSREPVEQAQPAEPSQLNALLQQTVEKLKNSRARDIEFKYQLEEAPHQVSIDEAKMIQAFVKILENALDNFDRYGVIQVNTRNEEYSSVHKDESARLEPGVYVVVEIIDEGPGMPPDVKDRIFEPFYTTKPGHRGLGLSWVYGILTNGGGGVAVSTNISQGCAVRLYLPATKSPGGAVPAEMGKAHILMVDDEEHVLETGRTILASAGYRVTTAGSAQQALEFATGSTSGIDLVITDLVMPQVGGQELIEQLKVAAPETRVLRISGYVPPDEKNNKSYLQKPFTSRHLIECVKRTLDGEDGTELN